MKDSSCLSTSLAMAPASGAAWMWKSAAGLRSSIMLSRTRAGGARHPGCTGLPAMRIAQIAPLYESVPPRLYGGTERVVSWLTEELVRREHEVTLFATGDSRTAARLV